MQIGNKWIFQRNEDPPYNTFVTFKIDDTTRVDGNTYYKIIPTLFDFGNYYRVDSLSNFLQLDNEKAILNFNMNVGDSIQIAYSAEYSDSGYTYCIDKKIVTTFIGNQGLQIDYFVDWSLQVIDEADRIIVQEGVGPVGFSYTEHDSPMILRGAVINGIVCGDTTITSIKTNNTNKINNFHLAQNYPNPFNSATTIRFEIPNQSIVSLKLFNLIGEEKETIIDNKVMSGHQSIPFEAKDYPSGLYLYQLKTDYFTDTKKLIIQK
jgi:hypothetical protein